MKRTLKDYFIPHEGNGHAPHFFTLEYALIVIGATVFLEILFLANIFWFLPKTDYAASILPGVVINLTNRNRTENGLGVLQESSLLDRAAQMKADDMARRGYFSHEDPEGKLPWIWFDRVGYTFTHAGENLAINYVNSEDVVSAWMRSESHRANITETTFKEIGIGIAKGKYNGKNAVFVVQFFGTPRGDLVTAPLATTKEKPLSSTLPKKNPEVPFSSFPVLARENFSNAVSSIFHEPHNLFTGIYTLLFTMILLAFLLMIFMKIHIQHPRLILNGTAMLLFVGSLILLNHYLLLSEIRLF